MGSMGLFGRFVMLRYKLQRAMFKTILYLQNNIVDTDKYYIFKCKSIYKR